MNSRKYTKNIIFSLFSSVISLVFSSSSSQILSISYMVSEQGLNKISAMADLPSEITKDERSKAITISPTIAAHTVGLHVPIKLTRENFLLWKTQIFPLLNYHDLAHILTQDPPISTQLDDHGGITVNPAYQTWWRQDQ